MTEVQLDGPIGATKDERWRRTITWTGKGLKKMNGKKETRKCDHEVQTHHTNSPSTKFQPRLRRVDTLAGAHPSKLNL